MMLINQELQITLADFVSLCTFPPSIPQSFFLGQFQNVVP